MSAVLPGRLSFRTVYGGPAIPLDVISELTRIRAALGRLEWQFDFDLFVTVGGDLTVVTEPTGLRRPRVMLAKRTVSGELRFNSEEVLRTTDPAALLRPAVRAALDELVTRVAARVPDFDAESERARFAFLRDTASDAAPS
ncbi:hypothetical protein ACFORO_19260 [Amycolatopsis halotolerans]|uniref:Uncharacterized protein n=1 Tax=Amycolatopsis halotolerans TaxID=330083 RepID=A0ABV7QK32_9PSEU